jgi:GDP-4-dehydro-6-deoxy-D-mannose reductase
MRTLVTGVDGFIGGWLGRALAGQGDEVEGTSRKASGSSSGVTRHLCDITDRGAVGRLVQGIVPDRVFHLAAINNVAASFAAPADTIRTNVEGTLNLLEAVRSFAPSATFVSVGSSAEYGATANQEDPLVEDLALQPSSPYGMTKAAQGMLVRIYARTFDLRAIHVRPFAVIGPGKNGDALSDFCRAVAQIEQGTLSDLRVGNIDAVRDFIDVRDCVHALVLASERGVSGETYNLCNGRGETLRSVLDALRTAADTPFDVVADAARLRKADDLRLVGDCGKLVGLGYAQTHSLSDTVLAILNYWRGRTGS